MKILYVAVDTPLPGTHGGSVHVAELCRALSRRGHDVQVVAPSSTPGSPPSTSVPMAGGSITHHVVARPPRFLEWTARRVVAGMIAALRPDVLVERFYTFGGGGLWAAHASGTPAVLEVNSPIRRVPGFWRDRLDRLTVVAPVERCRRAELRWARRVYATSRDLLPPDYQSGVTVVINGVDVDRFRPGPARAPAARLRCVYASSFRPWHGAEDLVRAVARCKERGVDLEVTCLGRGPRWDAARQIARDAGLDDMVEFVGQVAYEDVPPYLGSADVGLAPFSPSSFRGLQLGWYWSPIKVFEYLASGLVVATIDIPEMRALLPDAVARFYPAGDSAGLAAVLERLARTTAEIRQAKAAARLLAESRYTWDHQAAAVEAVLEQAVSA